MVSPFRLFLRDKKPAFAFHAEGWLFVWQLGMYIAVVSEVKRFIVNRLSF